MVVRLKFFVIKLFKLRIILYRNIICCDVGVFGFHAFADALPVHSPWVVLASEGYGDVGMAHKIAYVVARADVLDELVEGAVLCLRGSLRFMLITSMPIDDELSHWRLPSGRALLPA